MGAGEEEGVFVLLFISQKRRLEHKSMAQTVCDTGGGRCLRCTGGEMHPHEV